MAQSNKKRLRNGKRKGVVYIQRSQLYKRKGTRRLITAGQLGLRNPDAMTQYEPWIEDMWRYQATVDADGSGVLSKYVSLRCPTQAIEGSGVYERARNFSSLYDEFKVVSLTVIVDNFSLSTSNGVMGIAVDYDTTPTGTYVLSDIKESEYYREFSGTNQISYTAKDVPLSAGLAPGGADAVIHQKGWYDFATPPVDGYIVIAGQGYTPGNKFNITLTMHVKMRRRRTIPITRDRRLSQQDQHDEEGSVEEKIIDLLKKTKIAIDKSSS